MQSFKELIRNQQEIRYQLTKLLTNEPMTFRELSRVIGIATSTLTDFLKKEKDVAFKPLFKIKNYINKRGLV
jgi:DNA-binding Xre family transcriptional regulator